MHEWPELKPKMPGGSLPVLKMPDGTLLHQSNAIMRYLGSKHGYYPEDAMIGF